MSAGPVRQKTPKAAHEVEAGEGARGEQTLTPSTSLVGMVRGRARPRKARTRIVWTDELKRMLREAYDGLETGAAEAERVAAAKRAVWALRPTWSGESIVQELNRLGLRTPVPKPRQPLNEEDKEFILSSLGGKTFHEIAEELGCAEATIRSFCRRKGYDADCQTESYKASDAAAQLGVTVRQIRRWIWKWYLWTEHGRIPVESLAVFVTQHRNLLPPDRVQDLELWLGDLAQEVRLEKLCISQAAVSRRLGTPKSVVRSWVRLGWLEMTDRGIPMGALARFFQEHPEEIAYESLRPRSREFVKRLGYRA